MQSNSGNILIWINLMCELPLKWFSTINTKIYCGCLILNSPAFWLKLCFGYLRLKYHLLLEIKCTWKVNKPASNCNKCTDFIDQNQIENGELGFENEIFLKIKNKEKRNIIKKQNSFYKICNDFFYRNIFAFYILFQIRTLNWIELCK